jgi:hypothetical protein
LKRGREHRRRNDAAQCVGPSIQTFDLQKADMDTSGNNEEGTFTLFAELVVLLF